MKETCEDKVVHQIPVIVITVIAPLCVCMSVCVSPITTDVTFLT